MNSKIVQVAAILGLSAVKFGLDNKRSNDEIKILEKYATEESIAPKKKAEEPPVIKKKAEKPVETEKWQREKALEDALRPSSKKKHSVSDDKQEEYTKHEALKNMTLLEQHLREGCRIMGEPCDCCEGKHLATIEGLADEGISFGINPIWEDVKAWTVERGDKVESIPRNESADEAIKEGKVLAEELRQLRKQL